MTRLGRFILRQRVRGYKPEVRESGGRIWVEARRADNLAHPDHKDQGPWSPIPQTYYALCKAKRECQEFCDKENVKLLEVQLLQKAVKRAGGNCEGLR